MSGSQAFPSEHTMDDVRRPTIDRRPARIVDCQDSTAPGEIPDLEPLSTPPSMVETGDTKSEPMVLDAKHVYLLMKKEYRISRNVRAQWFFANLNGHVRIGHHGNIEEFEEELGVISVIPCEPPIKWCPGNSHEYTYRLLPSSVITFLARRYRLVFCLDLSPSVMVVDSKSGEVVLDSMMASLKKCLEGVTAEIVVPGSCLRFVPQLYATVIAHSSSFLFPNQQVVVQGWRLTSSNLSAFLSLVMNHVMDIENFLAGCIAYLQQRASIRRVHNNNSSTSAGLSTGQVSSDKFVDYLADEDDNSSFKSRESHSPTTSLKSPETGFIDLLRYGILALQLLPDNTSAGIVVVTDGVINVPDIHVFQSLLTQLRNSTISCSFLHVGSSREPRCCWGYAPFTDLMRFISTASYGAYIPHTTMVDNMMNDDSRLSMNIYHQGMFSWSFQWAPYIDKVVFRNATNASQNGISPFNGMNFLLKDDFRLETKKHAEKNIATPLQTLLSCRLREGYAVQHVSVVGNRLEVSMMLPWKHDVNINYVTSSTWPPDSSLCHYKVVVKGSYEFLHDLTCPTKKPIKSVHRSSVVKKFFEALQQLSQTDDLLTHLHSFASSPTYYMIPESVRNGVPLFYLPNGSSRPILFCSDFLSPKFAEFWEPICLLDINIWQKWMHAHRIGLLLAHDRPLPRHLHAPNSNGRYTMVQCRQALAALDTVLADFTSFVLVENHSYIKLIFGEPDKPPTSFVIIRVISQAPCMVIRLAFLGGTPSRNRIQIVDELRVKILALTSPSRGNLKTSSNVKASSVTEGGSTSDVTIVLAEVDSVSKRTPCCIPLLKPVEKLLIRYERTPKDYTNPSERHTRPGMASFVHRGGAKTSTILSTLGHYLHHRRWVWSAQCDPSVPLSLNVISRILSTLVKIRLQKGFHFAHSHSGIINLVLEVQMKVGDDSESGEDELCPCVIQYVLFPPHVASSSPESLSEDEPEGELESGEVGGEFQMITECWVEPQHGVIARTSTYGSETGDLEGLTFRELPQALFDVDLECISTMLTFEHLLVMCNGGMSFLHLPTFDGTHPKVTPADRRVSTWSSSEGGHRTSPVYHVPFPYSLTRLLPRCPQAQLLFSTLTQDSSLLAAIPSCRGNGDIANELLMGLFHDGLSSIHDREVPLSTVECLTLPLHLRPECRIDKGFMSTSDVGSQSMKNTSESGTTIAKWRCYIKGLSPTHILLTFVPDSITDLCLLGRVLPPARDACRDKMLASRSSEASLGRRYDIPVYVVDCSLWGLIAGMVGNESILRESDDFSQDYRSSHRDSENLDDIGRSRQNSETINNDAGVGHLNPISPEPRTEDSEEVSSSPSDRRHWRIHSNKVAMVYSNCFVSTIYRCLRKKIAIGRSDILSSMEEVCIETALEIDISEFLQTICLHVRGPATLHLQRNILDVNVPRSTEAAEKVLTIPSNADVFGPCLSLHRIHAIIQSKFAALMRQYFSPVPANPDYYYYDPPTPHEFVHSTKSNAASRLDDLNDDDRDAIQFRADETVEPNNGMLELVTDLDSDDDPHPTESSDDFDEDGSSVAYEDSNNDKQSNRDLNGNLPPLFVHLTCSISDHQNSLVANCSVKTLPTCFGDLNDSLLEFGWSAGDKVGLNHIRVTLDVLCLTLPPEVEDILDAHVRGGRSVEEQPSRTTSLCSSTVKPCSEDEDLCTVDGYDRDMVKDPLGHIPVCQRQAVNGCVTEIKWMLKDEIASFARGLNPITETVLESVTNHVNQSTAFSRSGCLATHVPLHFVFGPENSLDKFVQEFQYMKLRGYRLILEGRYYYVALAGSSHIDSADTLVSSVVIGHAGGHLVVQNPHQDDGRELDDTIVRRPSGSCSVSDLMTTATFALSRSLAADRWASCDDSDMEDVSLYNDRRADIARKRLQARLARTRGNRSKSESELGNVSDSNRSSSEPRLRLRSRFKAVSLREESPPSAVAGDNDDDDEETIVAVDKNVNTLLSNDTEEGYEGDSSDDDNDGMLLCDSDSKSPQLPDFWLIMQVLPDRVDVYFQFRDAELGSENLHHHQDINSQLVNNIKSMCKLVNQALLLRDLHESRMCNQLLEPEANEDIWRAEEIICPSPMTAIGGPNVSNADITSRRWSAYQPFTESAGDQDDFVDCQDTSYLEATMKFMPGAFACPVVWDMQFVLHPRLKTGHGRASISRGVLALKSVLSRLSVNNRKNMFVYKERTGGAVFYLRLHELPPTHSVFSVASSGNDMVLQQVGGVLRQSIADESGSFGGSQSSSMQSLNVGRNPLADANDEMPEPRSRVNSMPEKDRLERAELHFQYSQLDSMSVTSRISSARQRSVTEDVITLSVHGITDAGPEIKEELVEALQGRLDDAVLDVISITLARNPMCKLTAEDVHFIQRPDAVPSDVCHFMVCSHALSHLPAVVYYLQQNLLQFLSVPKYVDSRDGSHFQRYKKNPDVVDTEPPGVFLYIMPQEAGSRGIACIVLSVVDGRGNLVCHLDCPRPNPDTHGDGFSVKDFDELTLTMLHIVDEEPTKKSPGPVALIQVQIWIKGKVDLEQLVDRLRVAIKHALWDLVTEYRLLTAPLSELPPDGDLVSTPVTSEPCTPVQRIKHHSARQAITESSMVRERAASPLFLVQAMLREVSISVPDLVAKCRSPTCPSMRGADVAQAKSPPVVDNEVYFAMDADVLRRREKYEVGEKGSLHTFYAIFAESWLEYGRQIGVPSVQKHSLVLKSRHSVQIVLHDMYKLIGKLVPDTTPRTFKSEQPSSDAFVPFLVTGRERRKASGGSGSSEATRNLPGSRSDYLVVGRNVRQWRASTGRIDDDIIEAADYKNYKDLQRYSPQIHSLTSETKDEVACKKVFIPRQRLLLAIIRDCEISLYTYNWAHDLSNSLMEESSKMVELQNTRSCFLSSIVMQKLGIFLNQPGTRQCMGEGMCKAAGGGAEYKGKCLKCTDIDALLKSGGGGLGGSLSGSRRDLQFPHRQRRSATSSHHHLTPFCDVLRDAKPSHPMRQPHCGNAATDPVLLHGVQFQTMRNADNRELQKQLVSTWQNREGRICVQRLKQISRVEHYCLTPILFHPAWRLQVAAARDHTRTCTPITEPYSHSSGAHLHHHHHQHNHHHQHQHVQLSSTGPKSRHSSGASLKSSDVRLAKRPMTDHTTAGSTFSSAQVSDQEESNVATTSDTDEWSTKMYGAYIAEFVQYLQTLGFVGFRSPRSQKSARGHAGKSDVCRGDDRDLSLSPNASQYLQKILLGGILLLELVFCEPYFGVKMYTLESVRLRALSNRVLNSQFVVAFLDECDKIKVCMHLHSFTYDYHLRSVHAYVCGRQVPGLGRDYHVLGFLDDFVQYYIKSPNFARNLVHQGSMNVGPTTGTTARQLFNYLLKYDKLYEMRAVKMHVGTGRDGGAEDEVEHLLVQMSTHKVAFRDGFSETRQTDEFDMSLLISVDASRCDSLANNTLNLRYYIILTSCREMYPKPVAEKQPGTFRTVITPCLPLLPTCLAVTPPLRASGYVLNETETSGDLEAVPVVSVNGSSLSQPAFGSEVLTSSGSGGVGDSLDQRHQGSSSEGITLENSLEKSAEAVTSTDRRDRGFRKVVGSCAGSIRQEVVNYLGYFSSHEELMHKIIMEQVDEAKGLVEKIVHKAVVDCRRDSLWERLQRGGGDLDVVEHRRRRDGYRESAGMSYSEFMDLLSLVERKPLTAVDGRLAAFAVMPVTWYQTLVRVLLNKYHELRRHHFTAPDGNIQHLVILSACPSNWFILLSINLHSNSSELCVVGREKRTGAGLNEFAGVHSLVEDVVNVCCFHMWTVLL